MQVLLVKLSSLGDLVHSLPAVSDAAARGVVFDWVVEEAFVDLVSRHPAVRRVLPAALRRWRRQPRQARAEWPGFRSALRAQRYDLVLDAQGLLKSALVTRLARGTLRAGFDRASAREALAALAYERRIAVPRQRHAVHRQRQLFAEALGYEPGPQLAFGLAGAEPDGRRCVLLHGTSWPSKRWPEPFWQAIARHAAGAGFDVELPWGDEAERQRAERISQAGGGCWPALPLGEVLDRLAGARLVIGVDSGLTHAAAALGVPTVVLYGASDATLTGARGQQVQNLQADFPCAPCRRPRCRYRQALPAWQDQPVAPACYFRLPPERVWQAAVRLLDPVDARCA